MRVSSYLPNLYKNNLEMTNIIKSEDVEFENHIKLDIDNAFDDNFIKIATEKGIQKYEKLLNITIDNTMDLEDRRNQVIIKLLATAPYTYNRLKEILDTYCGKDNFTIEVNANNLKLVTHFLNITQVQNLINLLYYMLPANIKLFTVNSNIVKIKSDIKVANYMVSNEIINI